MICSQMAWPTKIKLFKEEGQSKQAACAAVDCDWPRSLGTNKLPRMQPNVLLSGRQYGACHCKCLETFYVKHNIKYIYFIYKNKPM